jgi:hypothetical protein
MRRFVNPLLEVASGEFDRRRHEAGIRQPGIDVVARLFNLRAKQLANFRANYVSRKGRKRL